MLNATCHQLISAYLSGEHVDAVLSDALEESGYIILANHFRTNKCHQAGVSMNPRLFCSYVPCIQTNGFWNRSITPEEVEAKLCIDELNHKFCIFNRVLEFNALGYDITEYIIPNLLEKMGYTKTAMCMRDQGSRSVLIDIIRLQSINIREFTTEQTEDALNRMEKIATFLTQNAS